MKLVVGLDQGTWGFNPVARTIQLVGLPRLELDQILVVMNSSTGDIIFNFSDHTKTGTLSNNVLTLMFDTSSMSASDRLHIVIEIKTEHTDTKLREYLESGNGLVQASGTEGVLSQRPSSEEHPGEIETYDCNLERVLGTERVWEPGSNSLRVNPVSKDLIVSGRISSVNSQVSIKLSGHSTVMISLDGTYAGAIAVVGKAGDGIERAIGVVSAAGLGVSSAAIATAAPYMYRCNVSGLSMLTVRGPVTSGSAYVVLVASISPSVIALGGGSSMALGSLSVGVSQKATSYESYTYDTNLAVVLGTAQAALPQALQSPLAKVSPEASTPAVTRLHSLLPDIRPAIRVQAVGSTRLPFPQDPLSNRMMVSLPEVTSLLEQIVELLLDQNYLLSQWVDAEKIHVEPRGDRRL